MADWRPVQLIELQDLKNSGKACEFYSPHAVQALRGVAEKGTRNSAWLGASPSLREILEGRMADAGGPSTPRSPFDNGAGPDLANVRTPLKGSPLQCSICLHYP